jgi:hypothetical protein
MMPKFTKNLKELYTLSPKANIRKVQRKLGIKPSVNDIFESSKIRPQRLFDFINRYQMILGQNINWDDLDFTGKNCIEIGSGPVLGWGPLAVFFNCSKYTCVEPAINEAVISSPLLTEKYFIPIYRDLKALYGTSLSLDQYLENLKTKIDTISDFFLEAEFEYDYDIVLSNSCLEHIDPLDETLKKLRTICSQNCRLLHLIDFGNHRPTRSPFDDMYEVEPHSYFKKYGKVINLLKAGDIKDFFSIANFEVESVPYYYSEEFYSGNICSFWRNRYSNEELFLKVAIIAGKSI